MKKNHHLEIVTPIIVVVIAVLIGVYYFLLPKQPKIDQSIKQIEDAFVEALIIKSEGDAILAGQSISQTTKNLIPIAHAATGEAGRFQSLADRAKRQWEITRGIKVAVPLLGFHASLEGWIYDMWQTAEKMGFTKSEDERKKLWEKIPSEPPPFTTNLSDKEIIKIMIEKIDTIVDLKEAGDAAIAKNDRQGMLQIAASLRVQNYYLKYHLFNRKGGCPAVGGCYPELTRTLPPFYIAAGGFAYSEPDAPERWSKVWEPAELAIQAGGESILGTGITIGPPDVYEFPKPVEAFFDNCGGKDGIIGGGGGVKSGLPTTESGYTCWHDSNKQCWDFLTYSGELYSGGAPWCDQEEQIPLPEEEPQEPPVPEPTPEPIPEPQGPSVPEPPTSEPKHEIPPSTIEIPPPPPVAGTVTGTGSFTGGYAGGLRLTINLGGGSVSGSMTGQNGAVIISGSISANGSISAGLSGTLFDVLFDEEVSCLVSGSMTGSVSGNSASGSYNGSCADESASGGWSVSW